MATPRKKPEDKLPPGRKPEVPTTEQLEMVQTLAGRGVSTRHIAAIIGKDRGWVEERCRDSIEKGRAVAVSNVAGKLYTLSMGGDVKAITLFLTNVGKWTNGRQEVEASKSLEQLINEAMAKAQAGGGGVAGR